MTLIKDLAEKLEKSQWNSLDINERIQEKSLQKIIKHAYETVPFYQKSYQDFFNANTQWDKITRDLTFLPVLSRSMVQHAGRQFVSQKIPHSHGAHHVKQTSGSTGRAVQIMGTEVTNVFNHALMLREHKWHNRDYRKKLLAISWLKKDFAPAPMGHWQKTWGSPVDLYYKTGPAILIHIKSDTERQIEGLLHYKPNYLVTYPSQAVALALFAMERNLDFSFLEEIRLTGETLKESYRDIMHSAWKNVKFTDIYSCVEIGNVASQCGEQGSYHVNTEHVFVEIVNDTNQSCHVGEVGKILLTSLSNYATPLIRYEIGDFGAWGTQCPCGRSFPVIQKIFGRTRNRLKLPNGGSKFPYLGEREDYRKIIREIIKFQFIQHTVKEIEFKIVVKDNLTLQQEAALKELIKNNFDFNFDISITCCADIPVGPTGKYEEFISLIRSC